jgi:hypothetical protein
MTLVLPTAIINCEIIVNKNITRETYDKSFTCEKQCFQSRQKGNLKNEAPKEN